MNEFNEEKFKECWQKTEVIREYEQILYTFGDMKLPYIFVAEHNVYNDRTLVRKGVVYIQKPNIMLPGRGHGPEFKEGFEHSSALPANAVFIMRSMGLPYSEISNKQVTKDEIEYGRLQEVIDKLTNRLKQHDDTDTGSGQGRDGRSRCVTDAVRRRTDGQVGTGKRPAVLRTRPATTRRSNWPARKNQRRGHPKTIRVETPHFSSRHENEKRSKKEKVTYIESLTCFYKRLYNAFCYTVSCD